MSAASQASVRASENRSYWGHVGVQLRKNRPGMVGLSIIVALVLTAVLAPLIANDRPIAARMGSDLRFPAFATYVDAWVPWNSLRYSLKSWRVGDGFPLSDHEPALEGRTWKQARADGDLTWDLWPPVPWNPNQFSDSEARKRPSFATGHWLGTDDLGRDVFARLIHGTVVAVTVGVVAMSIALAIGLTLGLIAGFFGGWPDMILSRLTEIVITFPTFFLIIAVIAFLEPSIVNIMLVIGLVGWTGIFRLIRGEVLRVRSLDYVTAAIAVGSPSRIVLLRHVLPNAIPPVFVSVAFGIAGAVLTETSLSFLGFGDQSVPSWGEIVSQGRLYMSQGLWHMAVFPGIAIFLTLTAFNLFGQGLRDAMDPKLRR